MAPLIPLGFFSSKTLVSISVNPSGTFILNNGYSRQLYVTAHWSDGTTTDVTAECTFISSFTSRATVDSSGVVTASYSSTGGATIFITYETMETTVNVEVVSYISSIYFNPTSYSVAVGSSTYVTIYAYWSDGTITNITSSTIFSRSNTNITISGSAIIGSNQGSSVLTANYSGFTATASITITAPILNSISVNPTSVSLASGKTQQIAVTANWSNGTTTTVTTSASYTSSQTSRATVNSSGLITAGNTTGAYTITVTYSGKTATISGTTTAATIESISVSPNSFSIAQGLTQQLTVTATMSNGTSQNVTSSSTYVSNQTGRATVNSSGLVTASGSTGAVTITVTNSGKTATASVTVTTAVVNQLIVPGGNVNLSVGQTHQLTVIAVMSNGTELNVTSSATYIAQSGGRVTVTSGGLVTAVATGSTGVTIQYGGKSTSKHFEIQAPTKSLTSIAVTPTSSSISGSNIVSISVIGTYSDSSTKVMTPTEISFILDLYTGYGQIYIMNRISVVGNSWFYAYLEGPPYASGETVSYIVTYVGSEGTPSNKTITLNSV